MAHFAEINNDNIVQRVIVVSDEYEANGAEWCNNLFGGVWVQTSYNNNIRKQYAGIGFTYLPDVDVFVAPQPYPSWTLDSNHDWQPPTPKPADMSFENPYEWSEEDLEWVAI
jgi:hypothetical protein